MQFEYVTTPKNSLARQLVNVPVPDVMARLTCERSLVTTQLLRLPSSTSTTGGGLIGDPAATWLRGPMNARRVAVPHVGAGTARGSPTTKLMVDEVPLGPATVR